MAITSIYDGEDRNFSALTDVGFDLLRKKVGPLQENVRMTESLFQEELKALWDEDYGIWTSLCADLARERDAKGISPLIPDWASEVSSDRLEANSPDISY